MGHCGRPHEFAVREANSNSAPDLEMKVLRVFQLWTVHVIRIHGCAWWPYFCAMRNSNLAILGYFKGN